MSIGVQVNWEEQFLRHNSTGKKVNLTDLKLVHKDVERGAIYITTPFTLKEYKKDLDVVYQTIALYFLPFENRSDNEDELDETDKINK